MSAFKKLERASYIPSLISSGNICVALISEVAVFPVLGIQMDLESMNVEGERIKFLRRVHIQFGHMEVEKLVGALRDMELL